MRAYVVKKNADMTEGRGPMIPVAYFLYEDVAWGFADQHTGVMGRRPNSGTWRMEKYGDWEVEEIDIQEITNIPDLKQQQQEEKKRQALAKLTQEERDLLGLRSNFRSYI